jgi:hypothetical protein
MLWFLISHCYKSMNKIVHVSWISLQIYTTKLKLFPGMFLGARRSSLMKETEGDNSRGTISLNIRQKSKFHQGKRKFAKRIWFGDREVINGKIIENFLDET